MTTFPVVCGGGTPSFRSSPINSAVECAPYKCEVTGSNPVSGIMKINCKNCNKEFNDRPSNKRVFCSNRCQVDHHRSLYVEEWKSGGPGGKGNYLSNHVRNHLIESSDGCWECGWNGLNHHTGRSCLEIDHINDDPFDHSYGNLQVLCPNCHAQKTLPPQRSKGGRYKNGGHPKQSGTHLLQ